MCILYTRMANKNLFQSKQMTRNAEGAPAYSLSSKHALAQYAATGCLTRTFYADAREQLSQVLELAAAVPPAFVAKTAIYTRDKAHMKDTPALLTAFLAARDARLHEQVFPRVIDNLGMLRSYVQILRSGVVGRKSLGTAPKRLVSDWLASRSEESLFRSSAGQNPSFRDVLRIVHPKPRTATREAFYAYILGRAPQPDLLPALVRQFEMFKNGESLDLPDLPLTLLTALPVTKNDWKTIARNASWQATRMNLNTFARHGVFTDFALTHHIAAKLRDAAEIARARVFPYQLLAAFQNADAPAVIREALQDAMEIAIANVPAVEGNVAVCPDVSGSMSSPVTGYRHGATTAVKCIDVAALVAAAIVRKNPLATIIPFEENTVKLQLNPRDSVMTNAARLASIGGGGTNCSAPLALLNSRYAMADLVILVSDNESWVDANAKRGTQLMAEWNRFRQRNRNARLVCLDIQPNRTTQAQERADILNIGGFSDSVFDIIAKFSRGQLAPDHWVAEIEAAA